MFHKIIIIFLFLIVNNCGIPNPRDYYSCEERVNKEMNELLLLNAIALNNSRLDTEVLAFIVASTEYQRNTRLKMCRRAALEGRPYD